MGTRVSVFLLLSTCIWQCLNDLLIEHRVLKICCSSLKIRTLKSKINFKILWQLCGSIVTEETFKISKWLTDLGTQRFDYINRMLRTQWTNMIKSYLHEDIWSFFNRFEQNRFSDRPNFAISTDFDDLCLTWSTSRVLSYKFEQDLLVGSVTK